MTVLRDAEVSAGGIAERVSETRPTVSYHLYALVSAGVIHCRAQGAQRFYSLDVEAALAEWQRYVASCPSCLGADRTGG